MPAIGDISDLRARVAEIDWFHSIELPGGIVTPGRDVTRDRVDILRLPDLRGRSVLDIGAWDGFFAFEAERRGAARVVAADSFAWGEDSWSDKRGFELARRALDSKVEDVDVDILDLAPERVGGQFDVVLLLGVLYHMRHPLLALERVASVAGDLLILETHVDMTWTRRPAAAFYPSHELGLDQTNWWGPNPEAVTGMLRAAGFSEVEVVSRDSTPYRLARSLRRTPPYLREWMKAGARPPHHPAQGRVVVHARRGAH